MPRQIQPLGSRCVPCHLLQSWQYRGNSPVRQRSLPIAVVQPRRTFRERGAGTFSTVRSSRGEVAQKRGARGDAECLEQDKQLARLCSKDGARQFGHLNRLAMVDALLAAGAEINPPGGSGIAPLDTAITQDDVPMVKALLERGTDLNRKASIPDTSVLATPLVTAVSVAEPDVGIVRILLQAGADPNLPRLLVGDEYVSVLSYVEGWLARPEAAGRSNKAREEIVRMLKQFGAKRIRRPRETDENRE